MIDSSLNNILINTIQSLGVCNFNLNNNLKEIINIINNLEKYYNSKYINSILYLIFEALYYNYKHIKFNSCQEQEGFFHSQLGQLLVNNRKSIWSNHYGVPPLNFILKYSQIILLISELFGKTSFCAENFYSVITQEHLHLLDSKNINEKIPLDPPPEHSGFIPTNNQQGYMTTSLDYFSKCFTCYNQDSKNKPRPRLLEIGAAYGIASLEAIKNGNLVVANDIDPIHLAIMANKVPTELQPNLQTVMGIFPEELEFPSNYFDSALICRVMHFFTPTRIIDSLKFLRKIIKPCGKIYIINETPYLANWSNFIPEYNNRKSRGEKWPGVITNPEFYCPSRAGQIPSLVHWLDHDTLLQALLESGFTQKEIIEINYINRKDHFPSDLLMPSIGQESIGCCITKID